MESLSHEDKLRELGLLSFKKTGLQGDLRMVQKGYKRSGEGLLTRA